LIYSIVAIIVSLVELAGIAAAVHAVMNARSSQGAIAWGLSLVTFPLIALPLYVVFGRSKFKGYVLLRHVHDEKLHRVMTACRQEAIEKNLIDSNPIQSDRTLIRLAHLPMSTSNRSRLLVNGQQTFESIFAGVASAEKYILVEFYIVKDDALGREFKAGLIAKAKQGIQIYFLYDEIGSYQLPSAYLREMRQAGIVTTAFHTTKGRTNKFQLNFRNHRKIIVIDGHTAFVGGHNVGDEYVSRHSAFGPWRDTHVRLQGPAVKAVQYCFLQDWHWATGQVPELDWCFEDIARGNERCLVIASGPADSLDTCALMFTQAINTARERFWIASPYFVPDALILGALKLAALRGVDVRILLPAKPDHRTVHLATYSFYEQTLPFGIQLYRYQQGFMHQKVFLVDNSYAAVGTANLDNRSMRLNFELTMINYDPSFIGHVETMLLNDFSQSRPVDLSEFTQKSFLFRLAVRFARLLAPVL